MVSCLFGSPTQTTANGICGPEPLVAWCNEWAGRYGTRTTNTAARGNMLILLFHIGHETSPIATLSSRMFSTALQCVFMYIQQDDTCRECIGPDGPCQNPPTVGVFNLDGSRQTRQSKQEIQTNTILIYMISFSRL